MNEAFQVVITVAEGGNKINVQGFPGQLDQAMRVLAEATRVVSRHFAMLARDGKLDETLNISDSGIVIARPAQRIH